MEKVCSHPARRTAPLCAGLAFLGCCFFPIYQLTPGSAYTYWWLNALMAARAYQEIGRRLGSLYDWRLNVLLTSGMTLLGFACRFLLEYGEFSNTVNFTPQNLALHLCAAVGITVLSPPSPRKGA